MGCDISSDIISGQIGNHSKFIIFYSLTTQQVVMKKKNVSTQMKAGAGITVDTTSPSLSLEGSLAKNQSLQCEFADNQAIHKILPGQSSTMGLCHIPPSGFLNIWYQNCGSKYFLTKNLAIRSRNDINLTVRADGMVKAANLNRIRGKCEKGHLLVKRKMNGGYCDGCHSRQQAGEISNGCKTCNFDLCHTCYQQQEIQ